MTPNIPPAILLDPLLDSWLREDLGRGDRTTQSLFHSQTVPMGHAEFRLKQSGVIAGLPIAIRVFQLLGQWVEVTDQIQDGVFCKSGQTVATVKAPMDTLLMGERVALNLLMRLSGVATLTQTYVDQIKDLPTQLVDTRKTTPGLRILEKYATQVGGAKNHRFGLDDAIMLKDNHIQASGGIGRAIAQVRQNAPYPLSIEVETETVAQVQTAIKHQADIIMLDNMSPALIADAVKLIRSQSQTIKIEASGNITLQTLRTVAETGVDFISTSATITQASWLDISLKIL